MGFFSSFASGGATLLAVLAVLVVFGVAAKPVTGRSNLTDLAVPAGWGICSVVLTVLGGLCGLPLYIGVLILLAISIGSLIRSRRTNHFGGSGVAKVLLAGAGYLVIAATIRVAAVDTFNYWLPNALFLHDHDVFARAGDATLSGYPAFPQNLQLIAYVAGLILPFFPSTAMISTNALLLCWLAWLLARIIADGKPIGWALAGFSMLLVTALNPTYVPDLALVSYGDLSTGIVLAGAAYAAWTILENMRSGTQPGPKTHRDLLVLGFCLAALINIKESNPSLVGELLIIFAALALFNDRRCAVYIWRRLWIPALPPLIVYAAWHAYLSWHMAGAWEHHLIPLSQWQWSDIPTILDSMLLVASQKGGYFGLVILLAVHGVWLLAKRRNGPAMRLTIIAVFMVLAHTLFLLLVYLTVFAENGGTRAQSFWRFSTQIGPLVLLTAVVVAIPYWRRYVRATPAWTAPALFVLALAAPAAVYGNLRIDLKGQQTALWTMSKDLVAILPPNAILDVVMFNDNDNWGSEFKGALTMVDPRRRDVVVRLHDSLFDPASAQLIWLNCFSDGAAKVLGVEAPRRTAVLVSRDPAGWKVLHTWPAGVCKPT